MAGNWHILIDGDSHYGSSLVNNVPKPRDGKIFSLDFINRINERTHIDFIVHAGDICDHGFDHRKAFILCGPPNGPDDEFDAFIKDFYNPLLNAGYRVYCTAGNHDTYTAWPYRKPVFRFLEKTYHANYNIFDFNSSGCYAHINRGVLFINAGIYPKNLGKIKHYLLSVGKKNPVVFVYHYATAKETPLNDWWKDEEKDAFWNVIKDYNVQLIINGHDHETRMDIWHGIPCLLGSGDNSYMRATFNNKGEFIKASLEPFT